MKLTKEERNKIFAAIARSQLDPAECELTVTNKKIIISHNSGSKFEFSVKRSIDTYKIRFFIRDYTDSISEIPGDFSNVMMYLQDWADEVKRIIDLPDFWAEMRHGRELIANIQEADSLNTSFTQDEQKQIAAQLQEIKKQIREQFELTTEQIEEIDARLDEAEEASKRIGRKDWRLLFGGTILNLIVTDTITPGVAGHIFTTVVQGLAHLFGLGGPPQILT